MALVPISRGTPRNPIPAAPPHGLDGGEGSAPASLTANAAFIVEYIAWLIVGYIYIACAAVFPWLVDRETDITDPD